MKPTYKTISGNNNARLRGTNQQTDAGLLWCNGSWRDHNGQYLKFEGVSCAGFSIQNNSGSATVVGFGYRIPNRLWIAGQWDASEAATEFVDDTAAAQDTTAGDFALETTTNNDGYVVASRVPFNAVSINVTTASVDATDPVRAVRYSNTAGSGWTAITIGDLVVSDGISAAGEYAAGENLLVFSRPLTWGRTAALSNIPSGYYAINVQATTAPDTTAALAGSLELWNFPYLKKAVADGSTLEFVPSEPFLFEHADAVGALIGVADEDNLVFAMLRNR